MNKTLTRIASTTAAAAVIGTGFAMATPAQAASSIWDKVAFCESTNRWDINTGNGFYGGLQFTISTWNAFGGQEFASRADRATKSEQILVAQRVLEGQGPGAWPVCSKYAGLTRSNGGASSYTQLAATTTSRAVSSSSSDSSDSSDEATSESSSSSSRSSARGSRYYTVKHGDSLYSIARAKGLSSWKKLYNLNADEISDPELIYPGQTLVLR